MQESAASPEVVYAIPAPSPAATLDEDARQPIDRVIERLGPAPVSIDELARAVDLPIREIRTAVLQLEMNGRIERHGGGLVSLIMT